VLYLELVGAYLLPYLLPPDFPLLLILIPYQVVNRTVNKFLVDSLHPTSIDREASLELVVNEEVVIVGVPPAYLGLADDLSLLHLNQDSLPDALHEVFDVLNEETQEELWIYVVLEILESLLD
jgi:hypothetical protein